MTIATLVAAAAVAAVALLVVVVVRLEHRMQSLDAEVEALRAAAPGEPSGLPPAPEGMPRTRPEEPVALITDLSQQGGVGPVDEPTAGQVVSVTVGGPLIKIAAFSHGVRRALDEEHRMRIAYAFRRELRRQRRMRRRGPVDRPPAKEGWRP